MIAESRNIVLAIFLGGFCLLACSRELPKEVGPKEKTGQGKSELVIPAVGAYTGAYVDFGEAEDDVTLEAIQGFEEAVGRKQAMIAFSSYWGRQSFPKRQLNIVNNAGAVALVYWSPWDFPYTQQGKPDRFALTNILAGMWDDYIDSWARSAKEYGRPMLVAFALEMNGEWFPWCGVHYGGGKPQQGAIADSSANQLTQGPATYVKAYRYVVDRVRKVGVDNISWVFHANNTSNPDESWNTMDKYWPGGSYVDWLGLSAYGKQYPGPGWIPYSEVLTKYYEEIIKLDPDKPFVLAEWGVGEFPKQGDKGAWLREAFSQLSTAYPRLKAAVFWHERWQNGDLSYSNLRANSSPGSLAAYREGVANPFWIDRPAYRSGK